MPVERRGVRALQIWCRRVTSSYENVNILDMDFSWRDGLAFCAMIHHFRPHLIPNYESLSPEDIVANHTLAYRLAEEELGIPSLLDPQDMLDSDIPDKFSIVTYVSQFYHLLKDEDNSKSPSLAILSPRPGHSLSNSYEDSEASETESPTLTPQGTPKSIPRALFTSTNPILRNNKFSPHASPLAQSPVQESVLNKNKSDIQENKDNSDLQISLNCQTHLKSDSGVTVSAVCEDFSRKIRIFEER
jgi:hypothetical protein